MDVFVSWSGPTSQAVAELIRDWLPNVLQEVNIWVSSQDIEKGERWSSVISSNLSDHEYGLMILTKENLRAPWIMFEAGALSKTLKSRLIPVLCHVERIDLAGTPIAQFQNIFVDKDSFKATVHEMNLKLAKPLTDLRYSAVFEKWWPDFEARYTHIDFSVAEKAVNTTPEDRLDRIEKGLESLLYTVESLRKPTPPPVTVSIPNRGASAYNADQRSDVVKAFEKLNSVDVHEMRKWMDIAQLNLSSKEP